MSSDSSLHTRPAPRASSGSHRDFCTDYTYSRTYTDPIANENKKYTNILLWVNKKIKNNILPTKCHLTIFKEGCVDGVDPILFHKL